MSRRVPSGGTGRAAAGGPATTRTPPPVRPTVVLAGTGHHDLVARLVGAALPDHAPAAYMVLRHGPSAARSFIPGHRVPRDAGSSAGPLTRPPRRVALSAPVPLLQYVHLVVAPPAPPSPAGTAVLAEAVRTADGLVYLLDAGEPLPAGGVAELAELAAVAGRLVLVDTRDATPAERSAIVRQVPAVAGAPWYHVDDLAGISAELTGKPWLAVAGGTRASGASANNAVVGPASPGVRSEATREGGAPVGPGTRASGASAKNRVTGDDSVWREVLAARLGGIGVEVKQRFAADLEALRERCSAVPALLPVALDTELHALSLRATDALDAAARDLVGAVFAAVVEDRLNEAEMVRVTTALWRQIDPDDRTLLLTATAGVAVVAGATDSLSATGLTPPTLLPPICLAVSGNCHLMWHYRGVPDPAEARRWLEQAAQAVRHAVDEVLDERVAALGEAVEALASDAVDHGVLLA